MARYDYVKEQNPNKIRRLKNTGVGLIALLLIMLVAVGGSVAYLVTRDEPVDNRFTPAQVRCEVVEAFDGIVKSNVNVKNTGDTSAYVRVRLVSYFVNDAGQRIGGTASIPAFTPGVHWIFHDGFYYYTLPVVSEALPTHPLIEQITLGTDGEGGRQVIEVLAEAMQSDPPCAVGESWGIAISEDSITAYVAD